MEASDGTNCALTPRMESRRAIALALVGAGILFGACVGRTEDLELGDAASYGSDARSDGGSGYVRGTYSPGCPPTKPDVQSPCTVNELTCEYGDDYDPQCNAQLICIGGTWDEQHSRGMQCPTNGPPVAPPPGPNPTACPASQPSGACSGTIACTYGDTTCACGPVCDKYPVQRCYDAGIDWRCGPTPTGTPLCPVPRQRLGDACGADDFACRTSEARGEACEETLISCHSGRWTWQDYGCPVSQASQKEDIHYLEAKEVEQVARSLIATRLATYRYRPGVADRDHHLGFIIEDQPIGSPAVLQSRERVDLYGYVSSAVAAIQLQATEIETLRREVELLKAKQGATRRRGAQ